MRQAGRRGGRGRAVAESRGGPAGSAIAWRMDPRSPQARGRIRRIKGELFDNFATYIKEEYIDLDFKIDNNKRKGRTKIDKNEK
jgi:hypothetical protein